VESASLSVVSEEPDGSCVTQGKRDAPLSGWTKWQISGDFRLPVRERRARQLQNRQRITKRNGAGDPLRHPN